MNMTMIEYNHKGGWCIHTDIICQEGICSRCNIAIENRKNDIIDDICGKLNIEIYQQ